MHPTKSILTVAAVTASATGAAANSVGDTAIACSNGSTSYCCSDISSPDSSATGILAGLLNNVHVGANCVPITVQLLATSATQQCTTNTVCCSGKSVNGGATQLGCDARTLRVMKPSDV
ncbi:hypothetical protein CXG81DRAFT_20816 [Caulochytrium protostelioides]|uniref:Hydrophobin n=1 Tax=Caulochytrium protostelioides TaxID=1555241 RepID=A0A4P9X1Z3_9FUNG|nr:hypothetical protein CXG81DRAFT_20816 [Caulochytrium protostelioides]|eukprot:RKO99043.1 hypothetical protein CXG81DRAFT_20816 [Caulochytrium protostelioides]